jgi:hypothetical protein
MQLHQSCISFKFSFREESCCATQVCLEPFYFSFLSAGVTGMGCQAQIIVDLLFSIESCKIGTDGQFFVVFEIIL